MSWFEEQIKQRIENDDEMMQDAIEKMACAITGQHLSLLYRSERVHTEEAIAEILKYYHIKGREIPEHIRELNDILEFLMRPSGVMRRTVKLRNGWYKDAYGAMLASTKDGKPVALIPGNLKGYTYLDTETGKKVAVTRKNEDILEEEAICFYRSMPVKSMSIVDFVRYLIGVIRKGDFTIMALSTLAIALVGMIAPAMSQYIFGTVILKKSSVLLLSAVLTLFLSGMASVFLTLYRTTTVENIMMRARISTQAATMMRILSAPSSFFRTYSAGDLASRAVSLESLSDIVFNAGYSVGMTALFSLLYIGQIFAFAPSLALPAFLFTLVSFIVSALTAFLSSRENNEFMPEASKEYGMSYALLQGVTKIKVAGAEKRAFSKWADQYTKAASLQYSHMPFVRISTAISTTVSMLGTIVLYGIAMRNGISVANYMAFTSAYALTTSAFNAFATGTAQIAQASPVLNMAKPILEAVPEISTDKTVIDRLSGAVELSNVTFRYTDDMPNVLDNLSLKIKPGQYIAVVGKTGCGKSTLVRLLLGFEKPKKGAVYYDGRDLNAIDIKSLRKQIGVVMQDGKLFQGDIFSNITISAPMLNLQDAWKAAEMSGMAEDIRKMPMGMNTLISEGSGGISGGQRQRLLIARAIAPKPKILIFDEATSALDNITQKTVSESLDSLKCTRIVIAHRLSTIRHCDRIIVLEGGKIVEDGAYEELLKNRGAFAELVERQQVDFKEEK